MATTPDSRPPEASSSPISEGDAKKWGTHIMGPPAVPTVHPDNQMAATWTAADHQEYFHRHYSYLQYSPVDKPSCGRLEPVVDMFNSWSRKAETMAQNIWHNLKMGPSVSEAALGKVNLTARAITESGFESLFKQTFATEPNEKLKKTFACYLSTTTGPVAGTLYLSTGRAAFCSDRPLSFTAPSGQQAWSYYKVVIPLANIATVNPVNLKENPPEKYMQIVTVDGHGFWLMGFVNFQKASHRLLDALSDFRAAGDAARAACHAPFVTLPKTGADNRERHEDGHERGVRPKAEDVRGTRGRGCRANNARGRAIRHASGTWSGWLGPGSSMDGH